MVNQGQNHIDSPANMLQQQASYEVSAIIIHKILIKKTKRMKKLQQIVSELISLLPVIFPSLFAHSERPEKLSFDRNHDKFLPTFVAHTPGLVFDGREGREN